MPGVQQSTTFMENWMRRQGKIMPGLRPEILSADL
jgi:hypothetical protein